jgi:hypothetical protein
MLVECWMLTLSKLHVLPPPAPRTDGPSPPTAVHMQSFLRDEAAIHSLLIILGGPADLFERSGSFTMAVPLNLVAVAEMRAVV